MGGGKKKSGLVCHDSRVCVVETTLWRPVLYGALRFSSSLNTVPLNSKRSAFGTAVHLRVSSKVVETKSRHAHSDVLATHLVLHERTPWL